MNRKTKINQNINGIKARSRKENKYSIGFEVMKIEINYYIFFNIQFNYINPYLNAPNKVNRSHFVF